MVGFVIIYLSSTGLWRSWCCARGSGFLKHCKSNMRNDF